MIIERLEILKLPGSWLIIGSDKSNSNFKMIKISRDLKPIITEGQGVQSQIIIFTDIQREVSFYRAATRPLPISVGPRSGPKKRLTTLTKDAQIYTRNETESTIAMAKSSGAVKITNSFGIIGLVNFYNGYYMIVIKSRLRVAQISGCSIYKIINTDMIYLPV